MIIKNKDKKLAGPRPIISGAELFTSLASWVCAPQGILYQKSLNIGQLLLRCNLDQL